MGAAPLGTYKVNYFFPSGGGWYAWTPSVYNSTGQSQAASDLATLAGLGFNTVRITLAAQTGNYDFTGAGPTSTELAVLTDFLTRCHTAGMKASLVLFDFWSAFGQLALCEQWVTAIIGAAQSSTGGLANLESVEIKNECAYAATTTGYGGGFDSTWTGQGYPTTGITDGQIQIDWAKFIIPYIRGTAYTGPVTLSTSSGPTGISDLQAIYGAAAGQSWAPSWYEYHAYQTVPETSSARNIAGVSAHILAYLKYVLGFVGGDPAKVLVGEAGFTSASGGGADGIVPFLDATCGAAQGLQAQANYLQGLRWGCQQLGMPEPAVWMMYDQPSSTGHQFPLGMTMGMYSTSGTIKPLGQMYQQIPPGSTIPGVSLNGNMTGTPQADAAGNLLPPQWTINPPTGTAALATTVDDTTLYNGFPSVLCTGGAGGTGTPALEIETTANWPVLTGQSGATFAFQVALKASGSYTTGTTYPRLSVAFYSWGSGSSGSLLSTVNGPQITGLGTGSWTVSSLSATVPASADYARMYVQTGGNSGSIWVAGFALTGPAARAAKHGTSWYRHK